jgi:tetratricopeptide (TPR) repeat protein
MRFLPKPPFVSLPAGLLFLLLAVAGWMAAHAAEKPPEPAAVFDQANRLYEQKRYEEAIRAYQGILAGGVTSSALHFNLGNAWLKAGKPGHAVVHFRRAGMLAPRDSAVAAALRYVRQNTRGLAVPVESLWVRSARRLSLGEWSAIGALGLWLVFLPLCLRAWKPGLHFPGRLWLGGMGALTLLAWLGAYAVYSDSWEGNAAVVVVSETPLRHGPLEESAPVDTLKDGQEVRVLGVKDDWYEVNAFAKGVGWLKRDTVELVLVRAPQP